MAAVIDRSIFTDSHAKSILSTMNNLRKSNTLCDVTLFVDGCQFPVHRIVLAACSDYFCAMFTHQVFSLECAIFIVWPLHIRKCCHFLSLSCDVKGIGWLCPLVSLGGVLISLTWALCLSVDKPQSLWHVTSALPDLWSPSQPQSFTNFWLVLSYTAWWQRHTGVSNLPKATAQWCQGRTRTRNL